jgi:hypothetical protein
MSADNRHRLNVDLPEDLAFELQSLIPFGYKGLLYEVITRMLIEALRQDPAEVLSLIFARKITIQQLLSGEFKDITVCPYCMGTGKCKKESQDGHAKRP